MKKNLIPKKPQYKVNLHAHSTVSDGSHTPEELKELYRAHGYAAVAFTDHDGLFFHSELTDENFVALAGFELEINEQKPSADWVQDKTCHICAISKSETPIPQPGYDPDFRYAPFRWSVEEEMRKKIFPKGDAPFSKEYSAENISDIIRRLSEGGFLVHYNHPRWSVEEYPQYVGYKGLCGAEVYNHSCFLSGYDEYNGDAYDALLKTGQRLNALAADDCHHRADSPLCDMFGGFTMISADALSYENLIAALEKGDCYASSGPILTALTVERTARDRAVLHIETEKPADYIRMVTDIRVSGFRYNRNGEKVTEATFEVDPRLLRYVRFEVGDGICRAYTRAYFIDEID